MLNVILWMCEKEFNHWGRNFGPFGGLQAKALGPKLKYRPSLIWLSQVIFRMAITKMDFPIVTMNKSVGWLMASTIES